MTKPQSMTQVRMSKPYYLLTSFHRTKDCITGFCWQTRAYQAPSVGSYDERCGTDSEINVKVGKHTLSRRPLQVYPTNLSRFQSCHDGFPYHELQ